MIVSSPCLASFELFEVEIWRIFGNVDLRLNVAIMVAGEYLQGHANPNETVRCYANRICTNWRDASWDEVINVAMLYNYAWLGQQPHIRGRIRLFASEVSGKLDSFEQLFDKLIGAELRNNRGGNPCHEAGLSK